MKLKLATQWHSQNISIHLQCGHQTLLCFSNGKKRIISLAKDWCMKNISKALVSQIFLKKTHCLNYFIIHMHTGFATSQTYTSV